MTKGTKIFRITISILLALTMLCTAFFTFTLCVYISEEIMQKEYGIHVAGVPVTRSNEDDILGDGKVFYDSANNVLVFGDATIESGETIVYSAIDLTIFLIGENKFICTNEEYSIGICAGEGNLTKDLVITGNGSLAIELPNTSAEAVGVFADDLTVFTDLSVTTPDCENAVSGIVCDSSLMIVDGATVTVHNGAAKYSSAVRVRGNALFEEETALKVSVGPDTTGMCKGLSVTGDLVLGKNTTLEVSIEDGATDQGECIRVSGLMDIGMDATITASAKNASAIECFGTIEANQDATISAVSVNNNADIFCSGALVNRGATITAEADVLGGVYDRAAG